jgi:2-octaprenyl-6-methoxyphenol hydroxylase
MTDRDDVLIVGGGLVGASLACALAPLGLRITVVESTPFDDNTQPSFDERTIAITWSSRRVFEAIGLWEEIACDAHSIRSIHVSDRGHAGMVRLDCSLINTKALGYVIPTRSIGRALVKCLQQFSSIRYLAPANAINLEITDDDAVVDCEGVSSRLSASLLVIADGGRSPLGPKAGIAKTEKRYPQSALVAIVDTHRKHSGMAFERFTRHGPIALLPFGKSRFALAWTLPTRQAQLYAQLPISEFLARLQLDFGERAGFFEQVGKRTVYPLRWASVIRPSIRRTALIGNAAHEVHPVAGQGFNLGLRDVAELAEFIACAKEKGQDIGHSTVVDHYARSRQHQTQRVLAFTDGLVRLFSAATPGLGLLRSAGLNAVELFPPVKRLLLRRTAGLSGRQPRLARGLPLKTQRDLV